MRTRGAPLARYVAGRLVAIAGTLLVISFLVFMLLYAAPGSVEQAILGNRPATPEALAAIRDRYDLGASFISQYLTWLGHAVSLDLGRSTQTSEPVGSVLADRIGVTLLLGGMAFVLVMTVGVTLGVLAALSAHRRADRVISGFSVIGLSTPAFATGVALIYVFAVLLGWFPAAGDGVGFGDRLWHLALPTLALALTALALVVKLTRTGMLAVLEQDFVLFARARGVSASRVLMAHALRNALIPVITAGGLVLTYVITGAVFVEITFAIPGLGTLLVEAVNSKDFPMLQGAALVVALVTVVVSLLVDILYLLVDPRVRAQRGLA